MERSWEREHLMKMLYQMSVTNEFGEEAFGEYVDTQMDGKCSGYFKKIYNNYTDNISEIDELIDKYSIKWKMNRMPAVDLAILKLAFTEIKYMENIPVGVAINEAVELAKKFSTDKSAGFINGLLGKAVKVENL